jgi:hypothetical protein
MQGSSHVEDMPAQQPLAASTTQGMLHIMSILTLSHGGLNMTA